MFQHSQFLAPWKTTFDPAETFPGDFIAPSGSVRTQYMSGRMKVRVLTDEARQVRQQFTLILLNSNSSICATIYVNTILSFSQQCILLPKHQPSNHEMALSHPHPDHQRHIQPSNNPTIQINIPSTHLFILTPNYPNIQPSNNPAIQPSNHPTIQSSTIQPSNHPTIQPSNHLTIQPSKHPTIQPSNHPTNQPSNHPTTHLSNHLIIQPSSPSQPSKRPTIQPFNLQPYNHPRIQSSNHPSTLSNKKTIQQIKPMLQKHRVFHPSNQPCKKPNITP